MAERVKTEVRGAVLVVRIEREEKRNAIDAEVTSGIDAALNRLEDDPALRVGILTGTLSVFSAGTDFSAGMSESERGGQYGVIRRSRSKPLIAAVEGLALGGGFEIVMACDLVVASETARFGLPEVTRSLVPTCGGLFRAPRVLPTNIAAELLLLGQPIDAERAERLGLANARVPAGQALAHALGMAEAIVANGPVAVRETMRFLEAHRADEEARGWAETKRGERVIHAAEDTIEGVKAFFERRKPQWKGR
ncbi:enoyl-CoA hydratase/isomerase family protein [Myxococcota bacterium]|nr:enoyl-CoA hydratase/isomerase family protein [Myxococcota bacterium]